MMQKQTVYLPVNTDEPSLIVQEYQREVIVDLVKAVEGYFFTPEQLNEYTANVIRQTLETAAEKAKTEFQSTWKQEIRGIQPDVNKQSITNTFEETFKKFEV